MKTVFITIILALFLETAHTQTVGGASYPRPPLVSPVYKFLLSAFQSYLDGYPDSINLNLYIYGTNDPATGWNLLSNNYVLPAGHSVENPSITKIGPTCWLTYTSANRPNWYTNKYDVGYSTDCIHYIYLQTVDVSSAVGSGGKEVAWATEWFVDDDGSVHLFFAGSPDTSTQPTLQIFETHATSTLTPGSPATWSDPVLVNGGFNGYDPDVIKIGTTYHLFYACSSNYICHATSASLTTGYTVVGTGDWAGWGQGYEGPQVTLLPNGEFLFQGDRDFDGYKGLWFSVSTGGINGTWSAPLAFSTSPLTLQQGTVLSVPSGISGGNNLQ